jgi:plasmid stabilization system protein ParE
MQRAVRFHPAAVQDAEEAVAWYAERSPRTADRFLDELERIIDLITAEPGLFQRMNGNIRRAVFRHFPYYVVFRVADETVEIIAVAHGKRRPRFWHARMVG